MLEILFFIFRQVHYLLTVHSDARSLQLAIIRSEYIRILPSLGEPFENFRDIVMSSFARTHFLKSSLFLNMLCLSRTVQIRLIIPKLPTRQTFSTSGKWMKNKSHLSFFATHLTSCRTLQYIRMRTFTIHHKDTFLMGD